MDNTTLHTSFEMIGTHAYMWHYNIMLYVCGMIILANWFENNGGKIYRNNINNLSRAKLNLNGEQPMLALSKMIFG